MRYPEQKACSVSVGADTGKNVVLVIVTIMDKEGLTVGSTMRKTQLFCIGAVTQWESMVMCDTLGSTTSTKLLPPPSEKTLALLRRANWENYHLGAM